MHVRLLQVLDQEADLRSYVSALRKFMPFSQQKLSSADESRVC